MQDVAINIRKIRLYRNLSQEALAKEVNVTRQAVSNWENGKSLPDIDMLTRLAAVFQVDVTELIYGKKPETEFDQGKASRVRRFVALLLAIALVAVVAAILLPLFKAQKEAFQSPLLYGFALIAAEYLLFGLAPACLLALLSIWKDIRIQQRPTRLVLLGLSAGLLLAAAALHVAVFCFQLPSAPLYWLWQRPVWTAAVGILLFLGWNR